MKKVIILLFVLIYLFVFLCGCNKKSDSSTPSNEAPTIETGKVAAETVRLLYSSKDSLDPYTCVTEQNANLSQLIFEPLLILNNQYEIEYRLAESVVVNENICTIKLIKANFSDGSFVTADDVVFSFEKAKKSSTTRHSSALKYAISAVAQNSTTIIISLKRNDPFFANLLTFPIMKKDTDQLKDTDNKALVPIGAGRFVFNNQNATLSENTHYYGDKSAIKKIQTVDCPDNESVEQAINAGMVDHYFSHLSGNTIPKMNGNSINVLQNRIVFLGVNPNHPQLTNSLFRQAISAALNRQEICNTAYFGNASPALAPVPTVWKPTEGLLAFEKNSNFEIAKKNIELAGFTQKDNEGFYVLKNNSPITFSLLVNSDNISRLNSANIIVDCLLKVGIKININAVNNEQYYSLLASRSYDLYLGEIRYDDNMDFYGLTRLNSAYFLLPSNNTALAEDTVSANTVTISSKVSSKINSISSTLSSSSLVSDNSSAEEMLAPGAITLTTAEAYTGYYNGLYTLQDLITAFNAELPVIPICFKNGMVIYSDRFGNGITPSRTELFHGIQYLK